MTDKLTNEMSLKERLELIRANVFVAVSAFNRDIQEFERITGLKVNLGIYRMAVGKNSDFFLVTNKVQIESIELQSPKLGKVK